MTRKKFIKMLMWAGMQRNDAADCAKLAQEAGRAYFHVLGDLLIYHNQHFKRPAFDIMWLRIRATIIYGANIQTGGLFRNIDEMHMHKDERVLAAMQAGVSAAEKIVDRIVEVLPSVVEAITVAMPQIVDAINKGIETGQVSALLGGGGHE